MDTSIHQELRIVHAEINEISATISRVQDRIRAITHNAEEQAGTWNATMSDLEQKQREVTDKMKGLEHQNAQLQRRSSLRNPEMEEVIHARDEALRKLRLARKVIRDLVDDNEKLRGENGSTDLEERHELREALIEALDENTSDKESEITARPRRSRRVTAASRSSRATASDESLSDTRNRARGVTEGSPSSLSSTDSSFLSIHPLGSTSSPGGFPESVWSIHYSEPPASSVFRPSLVTYALLMEHGISMEKTIEALESLQVASELCLRLHISHDQLAFLYDPIFLEGPSKSYILDWGDEETNRSLEEYIGRIKNPLHVFTYPLLRKEWFYIGAHTWKVVKSWEVWPTLNAKSRVKMVNKLCRRSQGGFEKQAVTDALDNGELEQLCVEISSQGHRDLSIAFGQRMGCILEEM